MQRALILPELPYVIFFLGYESEKREKSEENEKGRGDLIAELMTKTQHLGTTTTLPISQLLQPFSTQTSQSIMTTKLWQVKN